MLQTIMPYAACFWTGVAVAAVFVMKALPKIKAKFAKVKESL